MNLIDNWQDLPFNKYLQIKALHESETDELTKPIELVAILASLPTEDVAKIKLKEFNSIANKSAFFAVEPDLSQTKYKWKIKTLEETTMDDYIAYERANNGDETNFPSILSFMTKNDLTEQDILSMPTPEVLNGFFLFRKQLAKSINFSLLSLHWQVAKTKVMNKLAFWRKK